MANSTWGRRIALRLGRVRKSWVVLFVGALLTGIAAISPVFDFWEKAQVAFGFKPDQLQIARDTEKGAFSKRLVENAWRRLFWMRRYGLDVEDGLPLATRNDDWSSYLKALEIWNTELMTNIMQLKKYYNKTKVTKFQYNIQTEFGILHDCMNRLHFREAYAAKRDARCKIDGEIGGDDAQNAVVLHHGLDRLNNTLWCFATALNPEGDPCEKK